MHWRRVLLVSIAAYACRDNTTAVRPAGRPAALEIVAGNEQSAIVGTELPTPLTAKVVDSTGAPVQGQLVNFRVTAGGGSVFAGAAITSASGMVQERWTLGPSAADSQRVEARAVDNVTGAPLVFAVFRAIGLPAGAARIVKVSGDSQAATMGTPTSDSLVVKVIDQFGNPVPGVTIQWSTTTGTIGPATALTNSNGQASVSWTLGMRMGTDTALASATGVPTARFTASALLGFSVVSPGYTSCGIGLDSLAYCWGRNQFGSLGVADGPEGCPSDACSRTAVRVSPSLKFRTVTVGTTYACGITIAGDAYCWGNDGKGQLGDGRIDSTAVTAVPVRAQAGATFTRIAAGQFHTCAVTAQGRAYCWGWNNAGQVGDGSTVNRSTPIQVGDTITWRDIAPGWNHTCGLSVEGRIWCWGDNRDGSLGVDTAGTRESCQRWDNADSVATSYCKHTPVAVGGGLRFAAVTTSLGGENSCGLASDGTSYCWGPGAIYGSPPGLGSQWCPATQTTSHSCTMAPIAITWGVALRSLTLNGYMDCGLMQGGDAYCRSPGYGGRVGDGTPFPRAVLTLVAGGHKFGSLSTGSGAMTTCGVALPDGAAYCWGDNPFGSVGAELTTDPVLAPARVIY